MSATTGDLSGPWRLHEPGVLDLADSPFVRHIASPDAHVDPARREVRLYYHGPLTAAERAGPSGRWGGQATRAAISPDGIHFTARGWIAGPARQLRDPAIFEEDGQTYLLYAVAGEQGLAIARLVEPPEPA